MLPPYLPASRAPRQNEEVLSRIHPKPHGLLNQLCRVNLESRGRKYAAVPYSLPGFYTVVSRMEPTVNARFRMGSRGRFDTRGRGLQAQIHEDCRRRYTISAPPTRQPNSAKANAVARRAPLAVGEHRLQVRVRLRAARLGAAIPDHERRHVRRHVGGHALEPLARGLETVGKPRSMETGGPRVSAPAIRVLVYRSTDHVNPSETAQSVGSMRETIQNPGRKQASVRISTRI